MLQSQALLSNESTPSSRQVSTLNGVAVFHNQMHQWHALSRVPLIGILVVVMITVMARMTVIAIIIVQNVKNAIPKPHLVSSFIEPFCDPHTRSTERRAHAAARTHAAMASGSPLLCPELQNLKAGVSQNWGCTFGRSMISINVHWGLYWGPLVLGNYNIIITFMFIHSLTAQLHEL